MNRLSKGYKWVIDQNWGRMAKIGFLDQKPRFWAQTKAFTSSSSPCSGNARKNLLKEKSCLFPNNHQPKYHCLATRSPHPVTPAMIHHHHLLVVMRMNIREANSEVFQKRGGGEGGGQAPV